jgi:hypothetical protein
MKVPLRTLAQASRFDPTYEDLQPAKVVLARNNHYLLSKDYMWCNWFESVGFLKLTPLYNYCDKCRGILWSCHYPETSREESRWVRGINRR